MDFLVVDFEFAVPRSYGKPRAWFQEIIEVGAVLMKENTIVMDKQYNTFVKPRFWPRLAEESYAITGIRQEDVDQGVSLEEALANLLSLAQDRDICLVAWGDSDRKVLGSVCEKYGLPYPFIWENYVDLAEEYKAFRSLERRASLKKAIEENAIEQIGILHSALDDAINAAQVMVKIMNEGWSPALLKRTTQNQETTVAGVSPDESGNWLG
jgi:sporulation inhibitor KapD